MDQRDRFAARVKAMNALILPSNVKGFVMVTRTGFVGVSRIGERHVGDLPDPALGWCAWRPTPRGFCMLGPYAYTLQVSRGVELAVFVYADEDRGGLGPYGIELAHVDAEAHTRVRCTRQEFLGREAAEGQDERYTEWQDRERRRWLSQGSAPSTSWRQWWRS